MVNRFSILSFHNFYFSLIGWLGLRVDGISRRISRRRRSRTARGQWIEYSGWRHFMKKSTIKSKRKNRMLKTPRQSLVCAQQRQHSQTATLLLVHFLFPHAIFACQTSAEKMSDGHFILVYLRRVKLEIWHIYLSTNILCILIYLSIYQSICLSAYTYNTYLQRLVSVE